MSLLRKFVICFMIVAGLGLCGSNAQAFIIEFNLDNHPYTGIDHDAVDAYDYGLRLDTAEQFNFFRFQDVKLQVNSETGKGKIFGQVKHLNTGDLWNITAHLNTIGYHSTLAINPEPDFDDLLELGWIGRQNSIVWNDTTLHLDPDGALSALHGYTGPRDWVGKNLTGGDQFYITYRHLLSPNVFPSPEWDLLTGDGWWRPAGGYQLFRGADDFLFVLRDGHIVPEPTSMLLFASGLAGIRLIRRRKKA